MAHHMNGKVVLITGASSGIGSALAREYARLGARVVATARREERLQTLVEGLEGEGAQALAIGCDVTRDGDLERAVGTALDRFGRIDHVHANAGFGVAGWFHKLDLEDFRRQFETNVFGVLRTAQATREALWASGGNLALMGSVNSFISLPGNAPYCMSKASVLALAKSLRHEFRPRGVAVTLVAPGFVESEIRRVDNTGRLTEDAPDPIPAWLYMDADKAARQIVRGVCRKRRVVVITGHGKWLVRLQRYFPGVTHAIIHRFGVSSRREPKKG